VKKKLPTVFICPSCGEEAVKVTILREARHAVVRCGACGLKDEFEATPLTHMVDIYCKFTDKFYSTGKISSSKVEAKTD
jgi:transcription elongation factor Elf1